MPPETPWAIRSGSSAVPDRKTTSPVRTSSSTGSVRYDANHLHERIAARSSEIVIPPKRNRKVQRSYDVDLYKERNLIERLGNELKQFRRVATRYDKLLANFMGFVEFAAIAIWLRLSNCLHDLV
jgi:hypothetical protein